MNWEEKTMRYKLVLGTFSEPLSATSLKEAEQEADELATHSHTDIAIKDEIGRIVALRHWWDENPDTSMGFHESRNPIRIGSYGYYGDWTENVEE